MTSSDYDFFLELEWRYAESQQPADFRVTVIDVRADPIASHHIGGGQPRRSGANDADFFPVSMT